MIIDVINSNKIEKIILPDKAVEGNYIIKDNYQNMIGNVVFVENHWVFYASQNYVVKYNGNEQKNAPLSAFSSLEVRRILSDETLLLFAYPIIVNHASELQIKKTKITIGRDSLNDICYDSPYIKPNHAVLTVENNHWYLECLEGLAYVNGRLVKRKRIDHGDILFFYGLRLFCLSNIIVVVNLVGNNKLGVKGESFEQTNLRKQEIKEGVMELESEESLYTGEEQFMRSPRFRTSTNLVDIPIAPPPASQRQKTTPMILVVGPQMTMLLSSSINLFTTLGSIANGTTTLMKAFPSILLTTVMMISAFLWPSLTRKYNKHEQRRKELLRLKTYREYLKKKDLEIRDIVVEQKQILLENNVSLEECRQIIVNRKRNLWERTIEDEDFLTVRIGTGYVKPNIKINYKEEEFQMEDDALKNELKDLINKYNYVEESPLNTSFLENRVTAIIGSPSHLKSFFESLLLQIMTFHIFSELKIVIFSDEKKIDDWDFMKFSPHCWDNQKQTRFICGTPEEKKKVANYLEQIIKTREEEIYGENEENKGGKEKAYLDVKPYYLIIIDSIDSTRSLEGIKRILSMKDNLGFSVIIKNNRIANLPSECSTFINIDEEVSGLFKNNLNVENQKQFKAEFNKTINIEDCIQKLANIHVDIPKEKHELPKSVGFLEMYGIGNVGQFNSQDRWKNNNPVTSLSVPVGIDQNGELFHMDIHEKAYGPHGLVAGTTGSGKSEWIITYILSLCVNFSPLEVQFVLIDYKGGGLAGSFVNEENGMRLPHLVGTITNLDKSEIRRSLASLEAESKRRQRMFNEARDKLNDSSMNIYKYQQYYRKGMLDEPLSHLFIISDEFAELKAQEPEFLDQLVSIARIGRSLGIHLILATQKPAGVVNEQMWSNSRFKVCLRVQDKADSNDMIKCDDAAYLKQTGAFYLQVGLNEFFALGQSAYAGAKYKPTTILKKNIDTAVELIDRSGNVLNTIEEVNEETIDESSVHGEELLNIILYISDIAKKQQMVARRLWLDSIPELVYVEDLKRKYAFQRSPYLLNPIIGEYDNPYEQKQELLTLSINKGNSFITGSSGSGKEKLLQTVVYSLITNYTPDEVNLYIADFGAETLAMFDGAPHIGGIIYQHDVEKIENLVRFAKKEYKERRKRYREFGGNYESFIKYSPEKDCIRVFIINSIETLKETYPDVFDDLIGVFQECAKYGIVFIVTSTDKGVFRGKVLNAFPQMITLRQTDDDYSTLLGSKARGIRPKELKGRGLLEIQSVIYEFQTATIYEEDKLQQVVKNVVSKLDNAYEHKAMLLPMIPRTLNLDSMNLSQLSLHKVCVGYRKETIEPFYMDLQRNFGTLIMANKKSLLTEYCRVFYKELEYIANDDVARVYLFDIDNLFKSERYTNIKYVYDEEINNTMNNLSIYIKGEVEKYNSLENKAEYKAPRRSLLVFHNVSAIFKSLEDKIKSEFSDLVEQARELGLFDFVLCDIVSDYKDVYRDKGLQKILMDSNGILIGNSYDNQLYIEMNTRDIRVRDNVLDKLGYIVDNGKGYYAQVLQYTEEEEEEE